MDAHYNWATSMGYFIECPFCAKEHQVSSSQDSMREEVLFVERKNLEEWGGLKHGFEADRDGRYPRITSNHAFAARSVLEDDPARKQIIPYVVISDGIRFFVTARKKAQTEARLHGKLSIGVGGHINEADVRGESDIIRAGMMRELHEELRIDCTSNPDFQGFLNDDTNAVGQVHLGAVFFAIASPENVSVRETEKMDGFWLTVEELQAERDRLETWSSLVLEAAIGWLNE